MLKRLSTLVAAGAFVTLLVPAAQALTPAPLPTTSDVITVAQGCGPGWFRNRHGRCVPGGVHRPAVVCRTVWNGHRRVRVCR
ncbi:MAG: hypothetical protein K2Y27_29770 [Xanthobacteraceae bacterium]|nr:hypothetical protein [Xanthobacteraceae bacterium]